MNPLPLDSSYYNLARNFGFKRPESMDNDTLMRSLGWLTATPGAAKPNAVEQDYRTNADQARAIASVARNNNIPFHAGLLTTGIRGMAAPVGRSKHQSGQAIDINERGIGPEATKGLYQTVGAYGLRRPLPGSDSGHIEIDKNAMGPFPAPNLEGFKEGNMNWEDFLASGGTPDAVGATRRDVDASFGAQRGAGGSFDPSRIADVVPEAVRPELDLYARMAQMRSDALGDRQQKPLSAMQMLGLALSEASVPVAYGTNNAGYGQAMAGRTLGAKRIADMSDWEKQAQASQAAIIDDMMKSVTDVSVGYLGKEREKVAAARKSAGDVLAIYGRNPEGIAKAVAILRSAGLSEDAARLESASGPIVPAPAAPVGGVAPSSGAPAAGVTQPTSGIADGGEPAYMSTKRAERDQILQQAEVAQATGQTDIAKRLSDRAELMGEEIKAFEKTRGEEQAKAAFAAKERERKRTEEMPAARGALNTGLANLDSSIAIIDDLIQPADDGGVTLSDGAASNFGGLWNTYMMNRPGGAAADAWSKVKRLKDLFSVEGLQAVKAASGGIGAVTEKEWPLMSARFANIDENASPETVAEAMRDAKRLLENERTSKIRAFEETYGAPYAERTSAPSAPAGRTSAEIAPSYREGDTRSLNGVIYKRGADGKWRRQDAAPLPTTPDYVSP